MSSTDLTAESFGFSKEELRLLVSIKYTGMKHEAGHTQSYSRVRKYFKSDIGNTERMDYVDKKIKWIEKWKETTCALLGIEDVIPSNEVQSAAQLEMPRARRAAMQVEIATFEPYFKLDKDDFSYYGLKYDGSDRSNYHNKCAELWSDSTEQHQASITRAARMLYAYNCFSECAKKISKAVSGTNWTWAWIGLGAVILLITAPMLAGVVGGAMGLSGAAATSAGLAFLGGGSLAAGGLGMTGGYVALMAGGALLGYGTGNQEYKTRLKQSTKEELLVSCSKLYAVSCVLGILPGDKLEICSKALALQTEYESEADKSFTAYDKKKGEDSYNKAMVLAAFRRVMRGDL